MVGKSPAPTAAVDDEQEQGPGQQPTPPQRDAVEPILHRKDACRVERLNTRQPRYEHSCQRECQQ
jgi:hypothetical protein